MIEPEINYAYLPWSLIFFVCSKLIDGWKSYTNYSFLLYFLASISQDMIKKGEVLLVMQVGS